jgi:peroxisomal 2,4-dienoyl-CoA reductase
LVNGAAGNFLCPFEKLSVNAFKTVLMIDTVGTFLLSKFTTQYGFKNGGVIINISAYLHQTGVAWQTHAGTAKAGIDAMTRHLAV